jgi:transposase-like protein
MALFALVIGKWHARAIMWGATGMDRDGFERWLASIADLTAEQRGHGFLALALAEAGGDMKLAPPAPVNVMSAPAVVPGSTDRGPFREVSPPADVTENPSSAASVSDLVSLTAAAQSRIERTGCPHCASHKLQRWGLVSGLPRYRCGDCRRSFNALTGTPLARLRMKDRWADQARALMTGESLVEVAKRCEVDVTTAFRWRHRFLSAPAVDKPSQLTGIVEADETYILESFKGRRSGLARPAHKRGGMAKTSGLSAEQIPVLVARDRTGATTDAVLAKRDRASVTAALGGVVTPDNQLCCDGGKAIVSFARKAKIPCCILPKPGGPRPEAPGLHINNVNGYHGRLKEWLRPFHGVATEYLDHYLGWRRTVEALGDDAKRQDWLGAAMGARVYQ